MRGLRKTDANLNNEPIEGWNVIRKVTPYLWPAGDTAVKVRVVLALAMLLAAKLISVATPLFYKHAVDTLSAEADPALWLGMGAVGLTVAYGWGKGPCGGSPVRPSYIFTASRCGITLPARLAASAGS